MILAQKVLNFCLDEAENLTEEYHVIGMTGKGLAHIGLQLEQQFPGGFEIHKVYSKYPVEQLNVYIPASLLSAFNEYMSSNYPAIKDQKR